MVKLVDEAVTLVGADSFFRIKVQLDGHFKEIVVNIAKFSTALINT